MSRTLLIAESDAELCDLYAMFFTEYGYEVETATDGLDCLEKLRRLSPSVLLLDQELHWGGGDGVLAWLREQRPRPDIPVVLTTQADYPPDVLSEFEPPVVKFLPKPFAVGLLLETVHTAATERRQEKPFVVSRAGGPTESIIG